MTDKIKTGSNGENLAAEFLMQKGFVIVARNYRYKRSEIDLIVQRGDWLIFVEVKTRSSTDHGEPESFVGKGKATKIFEAAEAYIFSNDWKGHIRFDVVSVKVGRDKEIVHFEDAFH